MQFPVKNQIQGRPTPNLFESVASAPLTTPVLINDAQNQDIDWTGSTVGHLQDSWFSLISPTGLPGSFVGWMNFDNSQFTYSPVGDNVVGNYFYIIGVQRDGITPATNPSNIVQSSPTLTNNSGFQLDWEWDVANPPFWNIYNENGLQDTIVGTLRFWNNDLDPDNWFVVGVNNADGSGPEVTPRSNITGL